jgi:putative Holliday junction resolvase
MDDSQSAVSEKAKTFAKQLEQRYQLPTHLIDERLSSREAKERLHEQGHTRPSKEAINSIAAQVILENWLTLCPKLPEIEANE